MAFFIASCTGVILWWPIMFLQLPEAIGHVSNLQFSGTSSVDTHGLTPALIVALVAIQITDSY